MMAQGQMSPYMAAGYPQMAYGAAPMMPYNAGPAAYQGPMPPNPVANSGQMAMAPGYMPMAMPMPMPMQQPYANAAMDRPGLSMGNASVAQTMQTLQSSLYPAQREVAANNLASYDWRTSPQIVTVLATAAREDPAATVRCSCIFALARMGARSDVVVQSLNQLKGDNDPRVRQEADRALARMSAQ